VLGLFGDRNLGAAAIEGGPALSRSSTKLELVIKSLATLETPAFILRAIPRPRQPPLSPPTSSRLLQWFVLLDTLTRSRSLIFSSLPSSWSCHLPPSAGGIPASLLLLRLLGYFLRCPDRPRNPPRHSGYVSLFAVDSTAPCIGLIIPMTTLVCRLVAAEHIAYHRIGKVFLGRDTPNDAETWIGSIAKDWIADKFFLLQQIRPQITACIKTTAADDNTIRYCRRLVCFNLSLPLLWLSFNRCLDPYSGFAVIE
jgi:hypothetical protein